MVFTIQTQRRIINQKKIDRIVNNWTKKFPVKLISKILSKNNVPWGEVKTFGDFLKTKTAKNFLTNGFTKTKNIRVPKCAIRVASKNTKEKSIIPELGQDSNKILKSLKINSDVLTWKGKKPINKIIADSPDVKYLPVARPKLILPSSSL